MLAGDVFCGAGGMTDGMLSAGFDVVGVDVVARPEYRGRLIQKDMRELEAWLRARLPIQITRPMAEAIATECRLRGAY